MKHNKRALWLFFIPLLLPSLIWGISQWQNAKVTNYGGGGYKDGPTGERAAIKKLVEVMRHGNTRGKIRIGWSVSLASSISRTSKTGTSLFSLEADFVNERLTKYTSLSTNTNPYQLLATQYENVTRETIEQVAVRNGLAEDLVRYGAVRKKHGLINLDSKGRPLL